MFDRKNFTVIHDTIDTKERCGINTSSRRNRRDKKVNIARKKSTLAKHPSREKRSRSSESENDYEDKVSRKYRIKYN